LADKVDEEAVWDLLGRIRDALGEFLPDRALSDEVQTFDAEVDQLVKGVRILGNLPPRADLTTLNRKFTAER